MLFELVKPLLHNVNRNVKLFYISFIYQDKICETISKYRENNVIGIAENKYQQEEDSN